MLALMLMLLPGVTAVTAAACTFYLKQGTTGCMQFDLSRLPTATFALNDSYPEPYLIASPCAAADCSSYCTSCSACGEEAAAGYQLKDGATHAAQCSRCYGLGASPTAAASATGSGLVVSTHGGATSSFATTRAAARMPARVPWPRTRCTTP